MTQDAVMFGGAVAGGPGALASLGVTKGLQRYGEDIAQKGLGGVANILRGGGSKVPQAVSGVGTLLQRGATTPAVTSGITSVLGGVGQAQIPHNQAEAQQVGVYGGMGEGVPSYDQLYAQITLNLVDSGYSVAEASKLAELLLASEGLSPSIDTVDNVPSTEAGRKAYSILQVIDEIEGIGGGIGGGISQLLNIATPTTAYRNKVESANNLIRNLISGQNVTEPEKVNLQKTLIKVTDSPGIVEQKISTLRTLLSGYVL